MGVRKALAKINGKIVLEKSIVCPLQRENDWYIMDRVMDMSFKSAEVEGYLTAADVCNSAGTHISTHKLDGSSSINQSNVNGEVFNQKKPSEEAWRSWRLFWRRVSRGGGFRLQTPLRSWILEGKDCRLRPEWVWDPIRSTLFQRQDAGCYRPLIQQAGGYVVAPTVLEPRIPSGYPVHVTDIGRHHVIRHNYQVLMSFPEQAANWEEYIMTLDQWERELLSFTTLRASPADAVDRMNDGVTFAASDGSVLHRTSASFGLTIIHAATGTRILQAMGAAPGIQPSSFRAEAYGALAVIRVIWRLSQFTGREMSFTLRHWIDNSGLVRRITAELKRQYPDPYSTLHPDWDVIQNLVSTMQLFGEACSYKAQWVKSHQDANRPAQELSLAARMNCEADTLAGEFQMMEYRERAEVPLIAGSGAHLIIAGATITGRYKQAIRDALSLPSYHIYLETRFQWEPTVRGAV
jgi:hypothetical protein